MKISKSNNQYYGSYFEQAITSLINKEEISNKVAFSFSPAEMVEMNADAQQLVSNVFADAHQAEHIGTKTSSLNGDILIDGKTVEVKYVAGGSGTHFNTSVAYTKDSLGFMSMIDFMKERGMFQKAQDLFGDKYTVSLTNNSPVSNTLSSAIRRDSDKAEAYAEYKKEEAQLRKEYVQMFLEFLKSNKEKAAQFIYQMVSKETSNKEVADTLVVFDHKKKTVVSLTKEEILAKSDSSDLKLSGKNSITNGLIKATFSWQNGVGLNNPTIRVFL